MKVDVSVIVPCYHVHEYLKAACASLRSQTFAGSWEVIFVDDGDPEGNALLETEDMGRGLKRILHQPNRGLSAARNTGLNAAQGEIILFFDPDDEVGPDWMSSLVKGLEGVDLAWGGFTSYTEKRPESWLPRDVGSVYTGNAAVKERVWRAVFGYRLRDVLRYGTPRRLWKGCGREFVGLWSRGYRRSVIGEMRFDEKVGLYEDAVFVSEYALRAQSMRIIGDTGYRYFIRAKGLMTREASENLLRHKFELRDARRRLDPSMSHWRGTFLLSALEILRLSGLKACLRYLFTISPQQNVERSA